MPVDYSNTHIYKLCCRDPSVTEIYVGFTTNFNERKRCHRKACCNECDRAYNTPVYKFIRDNGGWANWDMDLIDSVSVSDKRAASKVERHYVESLNAELNAQVPSRADAEWRADNKEHLTEQKKQYYEANKDACKAKSKQWSVEHAEEKRERDHAYWLAHKEQIKEYKKQWRQENKEDINEKRRQWRSKKREEQRNANL